MVILKGNIIPGIKDSEKRFKKSDFRAAYQKATGEDPPRGTLNVKVKGCIPIKEHFRIRGSEVSEQENFLFEICRINGIWAYRIRPYDPRSEERRVGKEGRY